MKDSGESSQRTGTCGAVHPSLNSSQGSVQHLTFLPLPNPLPQSLNPTASNLSLGGCPSFCYGVGGWKGNNNNRKEARTRCGTVSSYVLPNILLHHCPGVRVDHGWDSCKESPTTASKGTFLTLEVSQGYNLHIIILVLSYMHLSSNYHLSTQDSLLSKPILIPWFSETHSYSLEFNNH
jgi:hypothetical protein